MDWKEYSVNMERVAYTYNQFKILSLFYVKGKLKRPRYIINIILSCNSSSIRDNVRGRSVGLLVGPSVGQQRVSKM